jgi:ribosome-associated toxin RatA of RatAB toxin-antitoxin module
MDHFEIATEIHCSVEDVFSVVADLDSYPDWNAYLVEVRPTSDRPIGIGSTATFVGRVAGRRFEAEVQLVGQVPNREVRTRTTSGPFRLEIDSKAEAVAGERTRLTLSCLAEAPNFLDVEEQTAVQVLRTQLEASVSSLRALLEGELCPPKTATVIWGG